MDITITKSQALFSSYLTELFRSTVNNRKKYYILANAPTRDLRNLPSYIKVFLCYRLHCISSHYIPSTSHDLNSVTMENSMEVPEKN